MRLVEIKESFDSNEPYTVVKASNDSFVTNAEIGERTIVFTANMREVGMDTAPTLAWEIEFIERSADSRSYNKTGSGNELQVFTFVIDSIKELVARYAPDEIIFGSEQSDINRTTLYTRLANRVKLPGYHLSSIHSGSRDDRFSIVKDDTNNI